MERVKEVNLTPTKDTSSEVRLVSAPNQSSNLLTVFIKENAQFRNSMDNQILMSQLATFDVQSSPSPISDNKSNSRIN